VRKINLKSDGVTGGDKYRKHGSQASIWVSFLILLIAGALYGGVFYLNQSTQKQITSVKAEIDNLKRRLDTDKSFKEVYDFQSRLLELMRLAKGKIVQSNLLTKIAGATLQDVKVDSIDAKNKKGNLMTEVSFFAPNLDVIAKQIKSYNGLVGSGQQVILKKSDVKDSSMKTIVTFPVDMKK